MTQLQQTRNLISSTSETVNRVMGIKEWGLVIILSILWGGLLSLTNEEIFRGKIWIAC